MRDDKRLSLELKAYFASVSSDQLALAIGTDGRIEVVLDALEAAFEAGQKTARADAVNRLESIRNRLHQACGPTVAHEELKQLYIEVERIRHGQPIIAG